MLSCACEGLAVCLIVPLRPVLYFLLNCGHSVAGVWVRTQELRTAASTALFFKLVEEVGHFSGVVSGLVQDDRAHSISLRLIAARVFQSQCTSTNPNAKPGQRADCSGAQDAAQNAQHTLCHRLFRRLL